MTIVLPFVAAVLVLAGGAAKVSATEYDYVIVGSGPGGGSLAWVSGPLYAFE